MDDKTRKVADRMKSSFIELAETQSTVAIGQAVVSLIEQGKQLNIESIITHLQHETEKHPDLMTRAQHEAAEKELLAAQTKSQSK